MDRRELLRLMGISMLASATEGVAKGASRAPALFISHGSPMVAVETGPYQSQLEVAGSSLGAPKAIAVISAHWQKGAPIRVSNQSQTSLIYDFGGFPDALYQLRYPAPGAPAVASTVARQLKQAGYEVVLEDRGLDHGAWVPLRLMFPRAQIPVLQISLPAGYSPQQLVEVGRALRPLRDQGVVIFGSGGVVHNLRRVRFGAKNGAPEAWAQAFDEWIRVRVAENDVASVVRYAEAPNALHAVPTTEHFDPLLVTLGASHPAERPQTLYEGFEYGTLSMRSFLFGA